MGKPFLAPHSRSPEAKIEKAKKDIDELLASISRIDAFGRISPQMSQYIDKLLGLVSGSPPSAGSLLRQLPEGFVLPEPQGSFDIEMAGINVRQLEQIHAKWKARHRALVKARARFNRRCRHAFFLEDIQDARFSGS